MWQGWINLVLGLWLIISGFIYAFQIPVNLIIVGILAIIFGFWTYKIWQGNVAGILGLWIFFSGSVFDMIDFWNFITSGMLLGILGAWQTINPVRKKKSPKKLKQMTVLED